jgi:membrane fusion protein (multidrug efflux system)
MRSESKLRNAGRAGVDINTRRRVTRKCALIPLAGVSLLTILLTMLVLTACEKKEEAPKAGPPEVAVTDVVQQNVPIYQEWVATLNGSNNSDITPKVQGYLLKQDYQDGYFVKKGQLLYQIDPRPFEAALDQAKAQVAVAVAALSEADTNLARDTPLAAQNAIPLKQLDTDKSVQQARKAQLEAAQANQVQSELNLGWTKVYSPIDGIAGLSTSQVGDLVGTATKMTTISQVNPIWAYFNISESDYLSNARMIAGIVSGSSRNTGPSNIEYIQANNQTFSAKGKIILVNRQVAGQTGTIQLVAAFANKEGILRPGGFGRVRILTGDNKDALLIPQAAVIEVQSLYQVIVITPDNKAVFRPVKVGERVGTNWIISDGLKPGERVVVEGIQKVQMFSAQAPQLGKEGIPVAPKPYVPAGAGAGSN